MRLSVKRWNMVFRLLEDGVWELTGLFLLLHVFHNNILTLFRLVMFLTDHYSIKEVLTFPFMKDVVEDKPKTAAEVVGIEPKPEEGIRKFPSLPIHFFN